uniref:Phosphate transport regulator n=1 Tax=Dechloromonas aromatica (strain RCB) TaxID=159087 RepID=Q47H03_DECAR
MFGRLMPKEGKYFDLFNSHAVLIAEGGKALSNLIAALVDQPELADKFAEEIDTLERKADAITHDTLSQLHTSFITPFDRDEIHQLINGMDDILDIMQDVAESISLYDIRRVPEDAKAMAVVTENCCVCVQSVVKLLHSMDNAPAILKFCHQIDELESEADRSLRGAMSKVFREEPDAREVIKLKEIYELLESVTDRCKDVAGTIEAIVLENS